MKAHPLSLIDDNEDNSSQTYISSSKAKKSLKEDDISTENTLNNMKKINSRDSRDKQKNLIEGKNKKNRQHKFIFDFKNKFAMDNLSPDKKTSDTNTKPGLIDDSNEDTKKEKFNLEKINEKTNPVSDDNIPKEKLSKNLIEKRDKKFSYHGKIYFMCAISMLIYQYISYIYLIEYPIIKRK